MQHRKIQNQQHKAILPSIVRQRDMFEPSHIDSQSASAFLNLWSQFTTPNPPPLILHLCPLMIWIGCLGRLTDIPPPPSPPRPSQSSSAPACAASHRPVPRTTGTHSPVRSTGRTHLGVRLRSPSRSWWSIHLLLHDSCLRNCWCCWCWRLCRFRWSWGRCAAAMSGVDSWW